MEPEDLMLRHLYDLAKHPTPMPQISGGEDAVLQKSGVFRPGEKIALNVHPTDRPEEKIPCGPKVHRHDFIEIPYLLSGSCTMEVEGQTFSMHEGDFVILDTRSSHLPHVPEDGLLLNIEIETEFFDEAFFRQFEKDDPLAGFFASVVYSRKSEKRYLYFDCGNDFRIRQLIMMICAEYYSQEVCCAQVIQNLTMVLLATVVRLQRQKLAMVTAADTVDDTALSGIFRYIGEHLTDVSRESLAGHFGYSYSYMNTILQTATGMSFSALKRTLRLQRAELLLRTTDRPITDVAHDSGFSGMTGFYDQFRKEYGVTPQEYRKSQE